MTNVRVNLVVVAVAMLLFASIAHRTGRIDVNQGRGWDGRDYANMLAGNWDSGTRNTALRPLIVMVDRPMFWLTGNAVQAFAIMNDVFVALLCVVLCLLYAHYDPDPIDRVIVVLNVVLTVAVSKYVAFYPVLIDAGALAVMALGCWLVVRERWSAAAVACIAAVLAREFGLAVVAFGIVRALRRGVSLRRTAALFSPAILVYVGWRLFVMTSFGGKSQAELIGIESLLAGLALWKDPAFAGFFVYFALTLFGGLTLFLAARPAVIGRLLWAEPEWLVFGGLIAGVSTAGNADIWRYLLYLLPLVTAGVATGFRAIRPRSMRWFWGGLITVATVATQRPWDAVDVTYYFRVWFPYYVFRGNSPTGPVPLWPLWGWRLLTVVALLWIFAVLSQGLRHRVLREEPEPVV